MKMLRLDLKEPEELGYCWTDLSVDLVFGRLDMKTLDLWIQRNLCSINLLLDEVK
jgi:hypothetical protein